MFTKMKIAFIAILALITIAALISAVIGAYYQLVMAAMTGLMCGVLLNDHLKERKHEN